MSRATFSERVRYRFDTFMSRGGRSIFVSLVVVFVSLLLLLVGLRWLSMLIDPSGPSRETENSLAGQAYIIFLEMTDPGNMNQDKFASPFLKVSGVLAGLAGVVILSMLIAFITTALDQKLASLRKGFSRVIESDHTLILGWNDRVVEILRELVIANESEDDACVVILSEREKEDMDDFIAVNLERRETTRVVTRSGKPSSRMKLETAAIDECRSVIVLATCADTASDAAKAASDTRVIKTLLAVTASRPEGREVNIVAELFFERSRQIARDIAPGEITAVDGREILAKILVQTSRSVGLSVVYSEILSFDGCELYFYNGSWPEIAYGALQFHFPDGVPIGIRSSAGELRINPPADLMVQPDDDVLILAEDDSTIEFRTQAVATAREYASGDRRVSQSIERELLIGWNERVPLICREYDDYVQPGSEIDILVRGMSADIADRVDRQNEELANVRLKLIESDATDLSALAQLDPDTYDNIIIVSSGDESGDSDTTDSETIVILLLLRQLIDERAPEVRPRIITEVMDSDNQELVARAGVNDFIISNRFVSTILAQISEEADIQTVYDDLFSEDGSEIYLKPADLYFESLPQEVTFADLMGMAQKREEVCIGVKVKRLERSISDNFGITLIPEKNTVYTIGPEDCLIVVSEDET